MVRTVIIDDEKNAREVINKIIKRHCENILVVGFASDVESGLETIKKYNPDLVLLDIIMPDGTGFDLLNQIENITFSTIFTTAFSDYAIKAFNFNPITYLLKPINVQELKDAINKAEINKEQQTTKQKLEVFLENINNISLEAKKIVLKTSDSIHLINVNDILRCESDGNYTKFHFTNQKPIIVSKNLKEYYDMLQAYHFFRPHQSHIVNINHIKKYHKLNGGHLIMQNDSEVPVSTRKRDELMKVLENI